MRKKNGAPRLNSVYALIEQLSKIIWDNHLYHKQFWRCQYETLVTKRLCLRQYLSPLLGDGDRVFKVGTPGAIGGVDTVAVTFIIKIDIGFA